MTAGAVKPQRIAVIGTGGTVAMTAGSSGLAPSRSTGDLVEALTSHLPGIELKLVDALSIASANLGFADLERLAAIAEREVAAGASGVVVIQGTDTIEESAFALELMTNIDAPLVVTGAMRGASAISADGPANLVGAIRTASQAPASCGVLVVLNDEVHAARYVSKQHTTALNAFASHEHGLMGRLHEGSLVLRPERLPRLRPLTRGAGPWPRVALLRACLDEDETLIRAVGEAGYDGLVFEALGAGHAAARLVSSLEGLAARIPVVLCSRTGQGRVCRNTYAYPGSETDLLKRGLISGGGLVSLKARILLCLCLRQGQASSFETVSALI